MSIEMMNSAWNTDNLTPTKKLILLLLGSYADENHQCYPSHRHIANKIGLKDTKGVQRTIQEFEKLGYLKIERRKKENGGYTSNKYTLLLPMGGKTHRGRGRDSEGAENPVNTKEETKTNNIKKEIFYRSSFEKFYEIYPKKVGKKKAFESFHKIKESEIEKVLIKIEEYAVTVKDKIDIQWIPNPATWLNQERWNDDLNYIKDHKKDFKLDRSSDWAKDLD